MRVACTYESSGAASVDFYAPDTNRSYTNDSVKLSLTCKKKIMFIFINQYMVANVLVIFKRKGQELNTLAGFIVMILVNYVLQ